MKEVHMVATNPGRQSSEDLLLATEVAAICGMSARRVRQLLELGRMRGVFRHGIYWEVRRDEAERFRRQYAGPGRLRMGYRGD